MSSLKSIFRMAPIVAFSMLAPTAGDNALAQDDAMDIPRGAPVQDVTLVQGEAPSLANGSGAPVTDAVKGSATERVGFGPEGSVSAVDGQPVGSETNLYSQIELFKGSEVVVLTVVNGGANMPVSAQIDAVKNGQSGPTNLIPFRATSAGTVVRDGPTDLIPSRPQVTEAALRGGAARLVPAQSPVVGTTLRDGPAGVGVQVLAVEDGSSAWRGGLRRADVIESVNRTPVGDVAELGRELDVAGTTAVLQVRRAGKETIVVLLR